MTLQVTAAGAGKIQREEKLQEESHSGEETAKVEKAESTTNGQSSGSQASAERTVLRQNIPMSLQGGLVLEDILCLQDAGYQASLR